MRVTCPPEVAPEGACRVKADTRGAIMAVKRLWKKYLRLQARPIEYESTNHRLSILLERYYSDFFVAGDVE